MFDFDPDDDGIFEGVDPINQDDSFDTLGQSPDSDSLMDTFDGTLDNSPVFPEENDSVANVSGNDHDPDFIEITGNDQVSFGSHDNHSTNYHDIYTPKSCESGLYGKDGTWTTC